ncbi:MAG TPA: polyprenyl synthetase family protein [Longimicrobiales bacterium]|nr:polyprenyl synthetase family protein [Longimicrobiales bacterium]
MTGSTWQRDLATSLAAGQAVVDGELAAIAAAVDPTDTAAAALHYALQTGGKRLRPILFLAAVEAVFEAHGETPPLRRDDVAGRPWVRAASAVELVHTYSLVHDDLPCMDDDDLRRGRPTTHLVHGSPAAMVAGLSLIPLGVSVLLDAAARLELPAADAVSAVRELCHGAGGAGMVGGQVLDLAAEGRGLTLDELRRVHALKTAALFSAATRAGSRLAGASDPVTDALGSFGLHLGMAFQITDDVLDETMDVAALGKTPGKDRAASKSTFPVMLGLDGARAAAVAESDLAVARLREARLSSRLLEGLARFAVHRDR